MEEIVFFPDSQGARVAGILAFPPSFPDCPVVVMCHGLTMSKDILFFRQMQEKLLEKSIASLRFDFFGHGNSEGAFEQVTITTAVDGVLCAVQFLKQKGCTKIGLLGTSFGGNACLLAAGTLSDLFCLALRCPVANYADAQHPLPVWPSLSQWKKQGHADYRGWLGKKTLIPWSFAADFKHHDGYAVAKKIQLPVCIVHGGADETVPVEQSKKLARLLRNGKLHLIPGANHIFSQPEHYTEMFSLLFDFIVKQVQ